MKNIIVTAILIGSFIMVTGCIQRQTATVDDPKPVKQQAQEKVKLTKPTNPNNVLLNVKKGMTPSEVRNLVGNPQRQSVYETGKRWVPFYHGTDIQRMDWFYGNFGHITFTINRYNNHKQVFEIHFK